MDRLAWSTTSKAHMRKGFYLCDLLDREIQDVRGDDRTPARVSGRRRRGVLQRAGQATPAPLAPNGARDSPVPDGGTDVSENLYDLNRSRTRSCVCSARSAS